MGVALLGTWVRGRRRVQEKGGDAIPSLREYLDKVPEFCFPSFMSCTFPVEIENPNKFISSIARTCLSLVLFVLARSLWDKLHSLNQVFIVLGAVKWASEYFVYISRQPLPGHVVVLAGLDESFIAAFINAKQGCGSSSVCV